MRLIELLSEGNNEMPDAYKQDNPDMNMEVTGITCDSRMVKDGFLFAALSGSALNGANFINDAVNRGARVILAENGTSVSNDNIQLLHHSNPRQQFARMAAKFYPGQPKTVAAITGTNGKTSVAFFLEQIWTGLGVGAASLGTL
ncbi:MAG: Mur ligase domain-containing protein, partial [Rhodospirillaceae bacterium]|nr:Mur ligase domain-containing protein [Rhodospirillaceae bacterium]